MYLINVKLNMHVKTQTGVIDLGQYILNIQAHHSNRTASDKLKHILH